MCRRASIQSPRTTAADFTSEVSLPVWSMDVERVEGNGFNRQQASSWSGQGGELDCRSEAQMEMKRVRRKSGKFQLKRLAG